MIIMKRIEVYYQSDVGVGSYPTWGPIAYKLYSFLFSGGRTAIGCRCENEVESDLIFLPKPLCEKKLKKTKKIECNIYQNHSFSQAVPNCAI